MLTALLLAMLVQAPAPVVTVPPDTAFLIAFEYTGDAPPAKFRLWCDGAIVKNYTNAEVRLGKAPLPNPDGSYTYALSAPGLALARHGCEVSVFDEQGERHSAPIIIAPVLAVVAK